MTSTEERAGGQAQTVAISNAVVGLTRDYTGRGPTKARTYITKDLITCVLADYLTKGERKLVSLGRSEQVLGTRREFQGAMRDDLIAAVESITERKVLAFMSDNHIDPDLAVESFVLVPVPGDEPVRSRS